MKSGFGEPLDSFLCSTGTVLWKWYCSGNPAGFLTCLSPTPHTHAFKCNDTHRHIWNQTHTHMRTQNTQKMTDTQVTHSLVLTPWLEACRRTGLTTHTHTHTHPALPTSVTLLFLYRALSGRGKKNWKTPCWLLFSGVTSPTQNVLVTPESTLCQPVPFWDCTHTQAAISGRWKPAFSSKVKPRWTFIAFKNLSCRESKAVGSGGDRCAWFLSAWEAQILVFMQESSLAEPNKNFVEFSSVTNRDNTNDTTQASCFILSLSQTPFLLTYKKRNITSKNSFTVKTLNGELMLLLSSPNSQQILLTNILCITRVSSRVYFHVMAVNQKIANI